MEEQIKKIFPFNVNSDTDKRAREHWEKYIEYKQNKEQTVKFFNKNGTARNILDYVKDSTERMNEYHLKPEWKESWQNNVFDPVTRNKLITIISILASARMKPELHIKSDSIFDNDNTEIRKRIYSDLLEAANNHNEDGIQLIWEMYEAMTTGTVIGYEGWEKGEREVKYITEYNPDDGEVKSKIVKRRDWDDVIGEIVPIDEFFPETIWTNDIKKVKRAFRMVEMKRDTFYSKFRNFDNVDKVKSSSYFMTDGGQPGYGVHYDTEQDIYYVLYYFDEVMDVMGIWVNGTELYYGALPFNHKTIPFWLAQFEPINTRFLFGKSLPDKLMGMQDVDNMILNAMLDQLLIALNSPIFVDGEIDLDEGYLSPGKIHQIDPGTKVERASLGGVDGTAFAMLNLIKQSMEESSASSQSAGIPTGGRKTKYEVQQLQQGALSIAGLFLQIMEHSMKRKYWLRLYNKLQYCTMPSQIKSGKLQYQFIELDNTKLSNGNKGKKLIQIVDNKDELPSQEEIKNIAIKKGGDKDLLKTKVEAIVLPKDYLINNDIKLEINIVPNSSIRQSQTDKDNKVIAYYQATMQNPLIDQVENTKNFTKAMGQPEELVKEQPQPQPQVPEKGMPGVAGMEGQPQPNMNLL